MKTSDKLLLGAMLTAMLLFGGASLAVYSRYKSGDIITENEIYRLNHVKKELPMPVWLQIKGVVEIHFVPADTFAIEFEKEGVRQEDGVTRGLNNNQIKAMEGQAIVIRKKGPDWIRAPHYYRSADTLVIDGYDHEAPSPTDGSGPAPGVNMVRIYGLSGGNIELENGQAYIEGSAVAGGGDYRFLLRKNALFTGRTDNGDTTEKASYINRLTVVATEGGTLQLGPKVHIGDLDLDLGFNGKLSELNGWNLGKIHIRAGDEAQLVIGGSLWNKLRADAGGLEGGGAKVR
jgi:hypothetical protein